MQRRTGPDVGTQLDLPDLLSVLDAQRIRVGLARGQPARVTHVGEPKPLRVVDELAIPVGPTWWLDLRGPPDLDLQALGAFLDGVRHGAGECATYPADPPEANASPSQKPYSLARPLAVSEKVAVPLSAATTR